MAAQKQKSFQGLGNPAEAFFSETPAPAPVVADQTQTAPATLQQEKPEKKPKQKTAKAAVPAGYKMNPQFIETKSKRVQLLMQPSLFEAIKAASDKQGTSVNELIHSILADTFRQ